MTCKMQAAEPLRSTSRIPLRCIQVTKLFFVLRQPVITYFWIIGLEPHNQLHLLFIYFRCFECLEDYFLTNGHIHSLRSRKICRNISTTSASEIVDAIR